MSNFSFYYSAFLLLVLNPTMTSSKKLTTSRKAQARHDYVNDDIRKMSVKRAQPALSKHMSRFVRFVSVLYFSQSPLRRRGVCDVICSNAVILRSVYSFEGIDSTRSSATVQRVYALCYADQRIKKIDMTQPIYVVLRLFERMHTRRVLTSYQTKTL